MKELKDGLNELAKQEGAAAMLRYGLFNNNHEAYAVLKEELEEMAAESEWVSGLFEVLWNSTKTNSVTPETLHRLHEYLLSMGAELVQCVAMVQKWLLLYEDPRVNEDND